MNKPTLFISSTVKDVQEVRASVKDLLENKLGYHILMSEHEGSKPKTPIEQCRKWANECDIFIAIIGHSYGWVIPHLGISVCEFEFNEVDCTPMIGQKRLGASGGVPRCFPD
jgi:hypothetical protein